MISEITSFENMSESDKRILLNKYENIPHDDLDVILNDLKAKNDYRLCVIIGDEYYINQKYTKAIECYDLAIKLQPDNISPHVHKGNH